MIKESLARKILRPAVRRWDAFLDRFRQPKLIGAERIAGLHHLAGIYDSTILSARPNGKPDNHISLGRGVYLGRRVELEAGGPQGIEIDEDTSLQDGCAVRGQVRIGAHCLFGHNALVISSSHRFRDNPTWLIQDQDEAYLASGTPSEAEQVRIEEDCWIGWGCAIMAGVYVGRGAVLGANSVITKDVGPYEIHGGVPNRKIGERLSFFPPSTISATIDSDLPYFYRGFRHRRSLLERSRADGLIFGRPSAMIVLKGGASGIAISGHCNEELRLRFWLNGVELGTRIFRKGSFDLTFSKLGADVSACCLPETLKKYTTLEWRHEPGEPVKTCIDAAPMYGISSSRLI